MSTNTTSERNEATVRKLLDEVINGRRPDLCDRYLAADRVDHQDYGMPQGWADGHAGFNNVLGPFIEAFPDLHLEVEFMVNDGDRVSVLLTTTGTFKGPFRGIQPTGKKFKANGVDIFRFNDEGKIAAHWGTFDAFAMLVQLGVVAPPGQPTA